MQGFPLASALEVRNLYHALVRLGRAASVLQEEFRQLSSAPGSGPTPPVEAGRKGGNAARDKLGLSYFSTIGKAGGRSLATQRGSAYFAALGKRGGKASRRKKSSHEADSVDQAE